MTEHTTPEQLVDILDGLRAIYYDLSINYVGGKKHEEFHPQSHGHAKATARAEAYDIAVDAVRLIEQLEQVNDRLVAIRRRMR